MSDTDSFIQEVTEELKRDRMIALWRRYGPYVIGAIVLVVIGAAGKAWYDASEEQAAREASARLIAAAELPTPEARAAAFADAAGAGKGALVARFRAAEAFAEAGDAARALSELTAIGADEGVDLIYRDLAAVKSAQLQFDSRPPSETIAALEPLVAEGAPFRLLALEMRAAALLASGDATGAKADLEQIAADDFATNELRQRVAQMLAVIGGAEG